MCSVIALGAVALGTKIVGRAVSASAAKEKGASDARYYSHLEGSAREQASLVLATAKAQTGFIAESAARETEAVRTTGRRIRGAQVAGFAASGVGGGSVTTMDVALDTLEREQVDEELIRYNANVVAWETNNQASMTAQGLILEAEGYRMAAGSARRAAKTDMWSTIIGTAADVAGTGMRMAYYA